MKHPYSTLNKRLAFQKNVLLDLILVPATFIISYAVSAQYNFSEQYIAWSVSLENEFNIDELPLALLATISAMVWFSARRYAEIQELLKLNHQLLNHANRMQEEERRRIAQDLHDDLGQYLNAIRIESTSITLAKDIDSDTRLSAQRIAEHSSHAYNTAKQLMYKLRPVALDDLGLSAALNHLISTWQHPNSDTKFEIKILGEIDTLSEYLSIDVYRVIQECLTNIARHANAKHVALEIFAENKLLTLKISDDGLGFRMDEILKGFGLAGMRERIEAHAGSFNIESTLGQGTIIKALVPINKN